MNALFEVINSQLDKHKIANYHLDTMVIEVEPSSEVTLDNNNDLYFFANAFADIGLTNGFITGTGSGNAMQITPLTLNMKVHKYQMFKGNLTIKNKDTNNILFVELIRITPIPVIENE